MFQRFLTACAACLCLSVALPAATLSFGSDLVNECNSITGVNVAIQPHQAWASLAPWQWISYANTGVGPGAVSPPNTNANKGPTASFFELLPNTAYFVRLTVFADDTAAVYLIDQDNPSGRLLAPANWRSDGACAAGPIGCQPGEGLLLEFAVNRFGPALLRFDVFQRGNGPFGLLYGGSVDVVHMPEEATVALVAAGLAWLWWRQRKQRRARGGEGRSLLRQAPAPASGR
jgi:hypothetical protein